ncbi:thymidylate synthase [Haloarculaceae archaeon H-GB11]|nr:thymidylate synthase [Haloarculaceae archaeon H-GB11]
MEEYLSLIDGVLEDPTYKPNRTAVDTLSAFNFNYSVDLSEGYPLLTTKRMDDHRWDSMIHEFLWYLSGEEHIRNLREETPIWNEWADDEGHLDTAYGRFWRRYPVPDEADQLPGESWPDADSRWVHEEDGGRLVFDQIGYVLDTLTGENPEKDAASRRMVINAWHPANAAVSTLPPCHYTFVVNVQGDELNVHLTQRSGDVALGIPFNIAAYSLLANVLAQRADLELGSFGHTIVDAHIYCGKGERGQWYGEHLDELRSRVASDDPREVAHWIESTAPAEAESGYDHVPGLLKQLAREPLSRSTIEVADKPLDELTHDDIELREYESHDPLDFAVAE